MSSEVTVFDAINLAETIVFTTIGVFGNSIVLYVFTRPSFRKIAMFRYLAVVSIISFFQTLFIAPYQYQHFFLISSVGSVCKLYNLFSQSFQIINPWLVVLSSFDRYLTIVVPTMHFRETIKYQVLAVAIIFLIALAPTLPIVYYFDIQIGNETTECYSNDGKVAVYLFLAIVLVSNIIPFILMILSSSLIFYQLISQKSKLQKDLKKVQKEKKFIKLLISLDFYFLLANLPSNIFGMIFCVLFISSLDLSFFSSDLYNYINAVTSFTYYIYVSCNIFVYFSCNKLFREQLLSMLKIKLHNKKKPSISTTSLSKFKKIDN